MENVLLDFLPLKCTQAAIPAVLVAQCMRFSLFKFFSHHFLFQIKCDVQYGKFSLAFGFRVYT